MTDIPIVELKPCPFCGSPAEQPFVGDAVECTDKDCRGFSVNSTNWNTRAPDPALKDCVEALEECRLIVANLPHGEELLLAKIDATLAAMTKGEE